MTKLRYRAGEIKIPMFHVHENSGLIGVISDDKWDNIDDESLLGLEFLNHFSIGSATFYNISTNITFDLGNIDRTSAIIKLGASQKIECQEYQKSNRITFKNIC